MKAFEIYATPSGDIRVVKRGFCWPAAFFGSWWAFCKRLWLTGIAIFVACSLVQFIIGAAAGEAGPFVALLFGLVARAFVRANANYWRTENLKAKGYRFQTRLRAEGQEEALEQYRLRSVPTETGVTEIVAT